LKYHRGSGHSDEKYREKKTPFSTRKTFFQVRNEIFGVISNLKQKYHENFMKGLKKYAISVKDTQIDSVRIQSCMRNGL